MSSRRLANLGSFIIVFGAGLAACTPSSSPEIPVATTGTAGDPGFQVATSGEAGSGVSFPTALIDAGVPSGGTGAAGVGGISCAGGVAGGASFASDGGSQPTIPSTPTTSAKPVPAISGGTLLALADNMTVAASDPERDQIYLVDLASSAVRTTVLQPGDEPGRLAEDAAGLLHVALRRGGAIVTIDPATASVTARQTVCTAPRGIAYQAAGDVLEVACAGGELVTLPAAGGAATRTVTLERDLRDVVIGTNGTLLVSTFRKAEVLVVGADGTVTSRLTPGSGVVPTVPFAQMRTPSVAWRMVPYSATSGTVVMLHQTGVTDVVNPAPGGYGGPSGCGGIVQTGVSIMDPSASSPPPVAAGLAGVSLAVDVAVSPDQTKVAMAVAGNAYSTGLPTLVETSVSSVTQSPGGGAVGGGGATGIGSGAGVVGDGGVSDGGATITGSCGSVPVSVLMMGPMGQGLGQFVAVSYSQLGVLFAQTREPATLWRSDTGATINLAADSRADTGHLIFHVNAGGGLACASCHPEGGEDGRVWNFACVGARRTQSIRGDISPTAPFHWDGSEPDFSHLMDDVFTGRMEGPPLMVDQKKALETWVDTIPLLPQTAGLDSAAVARGATIFNDASVGCSACHAGTLLTNNATVNVGTGQPFQVPSLRGVAWRAPFMHNGCAATLADRFNPTCGGGDLHGVTSTLTSAQLSDLETYLESL
jgi:hypothetical protein